jgi:phosphoribosylformylglycinamidine synthase
MKYAVNINVMPHPELLDPQGKTVEANLPNIGILGISNLRIGKRMQMLVDADSKENAYAIAEEACKKLLANIIMEHYSIEVESVG